MAIAKGKYNFTINMVIVIKKHISDNPLGYKVE